MEDVTRCMEEMIRDQEPVQVKQITRDEAWNYVNPAFYRDEAPLLDVLPENYQINLYGVGGTGWLIQLLRFCPIWAV